MCYGLVSRSRAVGSRSGVDPARRLWLLYATRPLENVLQEVSAARVPQLIRRGMLAATEDAAGLFQVLNNSVDSVRQRPEAREERL